MEKLLSLLDGKKTYLGWLAIVVYGLLIQFGVVESSEIIWGAIVAWTGVSYRMAITKK